MNKHKRPIKRNSQRLPLFARLSLFFFDRPRFSALLWLSVLALGIASYTTLLKREGFPTIDVPYSFVNGVYLVNDADKVDKDIGKPFSEAIGKIDGVKMIETESSANFYRMIIQYEEGVDAKVASTRAETTVKSAGLVPKGASAEFKPLTFGANDRGDDMLVSFYSVQSTKIGIQKLYEKAQEAADYIAKNADGQLKEAVAIDPFARGVDQANGQVNATQKTFDRFGIRDGGSNKFYESISIGIKGVEDFDLLALDEQIDQAVSELNSAEEFTGYKADLSYSFGPTIRDQINGLQKSLAEGLLAVLLVSALLIALRASIITVASMVLVIMATLIGLLAVGYSLNTITVFSLVLGLSLIVDDTIIMVEAIDAERRRNKNARQTVENAARKISRVMVAATFTAAIAFSPLLFVGGILGSIIIGIPVTVILSLLLSLFVALTFIPFLSKYLLLRKTQLGHGNKGASESPAHRAERFVASSLARPILWARFSRRRKTGLGLAAVVLGLGFIMIWAFMVTKVGFSIFPSTKDSNQLGVQMSFKEAKPIEEAKSIASRADQIIGQELGDDFVQATYLNSGMIISVEFNYIDLTNFREREVSAPQLTKSLETKLSSNINEAEFKVSQIDVGPPTSPFTVRIESEDINSAQELADDLAGYLSTLVVTRPDGTTARLKNVRISNPEALIRRDGNNYIKVAGEFEDTDYSTLVLLAEDKIKNKFDANKLDQYNLKPDNLVVDAGQEEENQDSFKTLVIAFPLVLLAIYILLTFQFKSLLQPALIFMAIPFSLFGITMGLWLTDNPFSFFTMLGFFALIGLSIKNTILLTDYANQAQRAGSDAAEAAAISLQERFRPLVATSLTAVVALVPLYLSEPFWEGLAVTLMFGLLSSTLLVITVFPYYYLAAESFRHRISRRLFGLWLLITLGLSITLGVSGAGKMTLPAVVAVTVGMLLFFYLKRRQVTRI